VHPYIAFLILNNPANHHPRPDECGLPLRELLAALWQRVRPAARLRH
jgi:hypothetical protein